MTIAELLAAIADAPHDAMIYVEDNNGDLRSSITIHAGLAMADSDVWEIIVTLDDEPEDEP